MSRPLPDHAAARQAQVAEELLNRITAAVASGLPADRELGRLFRTHREYGSRDRRFFASLVFSFFRWKGWLDTIADRPLAVRAAIAYRLDGHPATDAVDRLAMLPEAKDPLDNLDAKGRQFARWCGQTAHPSPEQVIPDGWLERLTRTGSGPGDAIGRRLLEAFQTRPPTWIRVRASASESVRQACAALGIAPAPHPRLPLAWQIPDTARLADLQARCRGALEIQDAASQGIAVLAEPRPGESWWDVCTGAGGKSLHLQELAGGRLSLWATDIRDSVLRECARRARTAGVVLRLQRHDALQEAVPDRLFDDVLLDAPCSGTGTWGRAPDARWRLSPEAVVRFARQQAALLRQAARAVKPGGILVYATCALTDAENGDQLAAFLAETPEFEPAPFRHPLTGDMTPGQAYLWPWQGPGTGLFAARLRRRRAHREKLEFRDIGPVE